MRLRVRVLAATLISGMSTVNAIWSRGRSTAELGRDSCGSICKLIFFACVVHLGCRVVQEATSRVIILFYREFICNYLEKSLTQHHGVNHLSPLFVSWSENSSLSRKVVWVDLMTFYAAFLHKMRGVHISFLSEKKVEGLFGLNFLRRASYIAKSASSSFSSNVYLDTAGFL